MYFTLYPIWYASLKEHLVMMDRVYTVYKEGSILPEPEVDHILLEEPTHRPLLGYLDLTALMSGDRLEIELLIRVKEGGPYKLHEAYSVVGPIDEPIVRTDIPPSPFGIQVKLRQVGGITGHWVHYVWFTVARGL